MKINFIIGILGCVLLLGACRDEKNYLLEGNITGLIDPMLYIEPFGYLGVKRDTVFSKDGEFKYEASSDSIQPILIFMEDGTVWVTVWAENGQVVKISGDAEYPELMRFNGNEVNELLTEFRQANRDIIKERNDTDDEKRNEALMQSLISNSQVFIREHPRSIASLVLIQDYLMESKDLRVVVDALSLVESPAKDTPLYKRLQMTVKELQEYEINNFDEKNKNEKQKRREIDR
ncbi:MAG: DUF4369 domain-containing protein [Dysgonamonadaceae bacterium]|nr:DUF4369 domain-containing protein [Dysgonamonadaceae bacterium]